MCKRVSEAVCMNTVCVQCKWMEMGFGNLFNILYFFSLRLWFWFDTYCLRFPRAFSSVSPD